MARPQRLRQLLQFDQRLRRRQRLEQGWIAGVDEAGRGPLAGPVVAGAVILFKRIPLEIRIDDSKQLTPALRRQAYRVILRCAAVGVGAASHEEIDQFGIRLATHLAMIRALKRLPVRPDLVLVDGQELPTGCALPALPIIGGDAKSLAIASASIVAKVVRDRWMGWVHRFHPEYGFKRHKGYGTERHLRALRAVGPCGFHRFSFRPVVEVPSDLIEQ